jgi:hypothetical protein
LTLYCRRCGAANRDGALYCHACGHLELTPQAPAGGQAMGHAIWNPNAAANWSLIFTPAFGSYLQMRNWLALGETRRARASRAWFVASLVVLFANLFVGMVLGDARRADLVTRFVLLVLLVVWYFAAGRAQARYVRERFGKDYARRPWGRALLWAVGAVIAYYAIAVAVGVLVGLASHFLG